MQLLNKFFVVKCCGSLQMIDPPMMETSNEITCADCDKVIATCSTKGVWYYVGNKVFNDES